MLGILPNIILRLSSDQTGELAVIHQNFFYNIICKGKQLSRKLILSFKRHLLTKIVGRLLKMLGSLLTNCLMCDIAGFE